VLPIINQTKRELSYKADNPIPLIDQEKINGINITINGEENKTIFFSRITVENTGQIPLKNIPINIKFISSDSTFKIYNRIISTEPKFEFGDIHDSVSKKSLKILSDLINPKDKIIIDVIANRKSETEVYSKSEGMSFKKIEPEKTENKYQFIITIIASILSTLFAFIILRKKIIKITVGGARVSFDSLKEAKGASGLKIVSAFYGIEDKCIDVTENLKKKIMDNTLSIIANNEIAGDPIVGKAKELKVVYSIGEEIETIVASEGDILTLPLKK
jgi:hypothetical protein